MAKKKVAKKPSDLLTIERVPIDSITPDPKNARLHSDEQLEDLKASLNRFGQLPTIFVDADGTVIKGNGHRIGRRNHPRVSHAPGRCLRF